MDRFRAGDTPELRPCGRLAVFSPHLERLEEIQLSVSEDGTREPEPVLPSMGSP